jgi:uncharacterized protein YbjT (DUF2867 family)
MYPGAGPVGRRARLLGMATVLVTGGTGTLGRAVVPLLLAGGHDVRVLSRRAAPEVPDGVRAFAGDVRTGTGVERAAAGCDIVIHAASNPRRQVKETEVEGARHVAAAARAAEAHLVYVSIVGVDRHRYFYYRAKYAAEHVVAESGARWSVLRATQFHDLLEMALGSGWFIRTPDLRFQPVAVDDVARRLVDVATGEAQGLAPDFAGPEVLGIEEIAALRQDIRGRRTRLVRVPRLGFLRDFDAGLHLAPDHRDGVTTWRDWLTARSGRR